MIIVIGFIQREGIMSYTYDIILIFLPAIVEEEIIYLSSLFRIDYIALFLHAK